MAVTDARPIPIKNVAYRVTFPIFDADGDLVLGTGATPLISVDGSAFATVGSVVEISGVATAVSGIYLLDLSAGSMNGDTVAIRVDVSASGAKATPIILYPASAESALLRAGVSAAVNDALGNFGVSTLTTANVSAIVDDSLVNFGVSTLTAADVSAVTDNALANFGVSTLTSAGVSAVVNDNLINFGVSTITTANASAIVDDALSNFWEVRTLTEAYAADGAEATPAQILYMLHSEMGQFEVAGTTISSFRLDGTTTAMTFLMNDASAPTSRVRNG